MMSERRRFHIVFNERSGTALGLGLTAEKLRESLEAKGFEVSMDHEADLPLATKVERALASDADFIVCAGGDGTVTALSAALVGTGKTLAILPLGTANLLARDLGLPLDLEGAVTALSDLQPKLVDVGVVNGKVFLHNVSIGFIPAVAVAREQIRGRTDIGAFIGFGRYFIRRLARSRQMAVAITSRDTNDRVERLHAIAVSNNAYDEGFGRVFSRKTLDAGHLTLYTLKRFRFRDFVRLSAEMLAGRWREDAALAIEHVRSVEIRSKKQSIAVMIDGEVEMMESPLRFAIKPLALSVLAPVPTLEVTDEPEAVALVG